MDASEAKKLWDEVRANLDALDKCEGPHRFEAVEFIPGTQLPRTYKCGLCGGTLEARAFRWYQHGLAHGRRVPAQKEGTNE